MLKKVRIIDYQKNTYWYVNYIGCVLTIDTEDKEKDGSYKVVDRKFNQGERLHPKDVDLNYERKTKLEKLNEYENL